MTDIKEQVHQKGIGRQIQLPLSKAMHISLNSIRIRFWRSMITAAGIFLGIAFFASVTTSPSLEKSVQTYKSQQKSAAASESVQLVDDEKAVKAAAARRVWLVVMSLLVCTIGIANSMLMSVTERFKEIGTMKCLGALDKFVIELFLLESGFLGVIASFLGWLIGFLTMLIASVFRGGFGVIANVAWGDVLVSLVQAVVLGSILTVLATIFPAMRAAKLPPAAAMRTDV
ncbi:MAG: FtsX-like permease family protein [Armatimonadetes bacterium]|nr:FtsX-like permease family protein [Armatimonadota bacterium]